MLEALGARDADLLVCCAPPSPRALDPPETVAAAARDARGRSDDRVEVVARRRRRRRPRGRGARGPDGQVVVTGSLYVVGAARRVLRRR